MSAMGESDMHARETAPIAVGLVQINSSFSGQSYLPYSVGLLQAYAQHRAARPERYRFLQPIYRRIPVHSAVASLKDADIAGFSVYVWNARISLEIARRLKAAKPETMVVFGGPHVPDHPEGFLRDHPWIDVAVHNEGEAVFLKILESFPERDWSSIPSLSFFDRDGRYVRTPKGTRFGDLDDVPSPYLTGIFDRLMVENANQQWIGLWETNRGCPFRCTYCDWGSAIAAKVTKFGQGRLNDEITWFADHKIEYVVNCDANFGILKRDVELSEFVADVKRRTGYPRVLSVQNTKNATERAYLTQKILSDAGLSNSVALAVQSTDMTTLTNIKRDNISLETYNELQRRFTRDGVATYSDLILALPGETYDSFCEGVDALISNGQHNRIQFNNLGILPNAEMGDPEYLKKYGIVTVTSEIINIHGERSAMEDDVAEIQELVIATDTMSREDWRRMRVFCWMTAFLHFDKLFQIPLIVAHELGGIRYRRLIEEFIACAGPEFPVISEIVRLFQDKAADIQNGGVEYTYSEEWLGIYWPADEYAFIKVVAEDRFDAFCEEALRLMLRVAGPSMGASGSDILVAAKELNQAMVKRPDVKTDAEIEDRYGIMEFYRAILQGESATLPRRPRTLTIERAKDYVDDFSVWCRKVVWWGSKRAAYFYTETAPEPALRRLAGHH